MRLLVSGASINISCETNGDIDAMDCRWNSTQWQNPNFRTRSGLLLAYVNKKNNTILLDLTFTRVIRNEEVSGVVDIIALYFKQGWKLLHRKEFTVITERPIYVDGDLK